MAKSKTGQQRKRRSHRQAEIIETAAEAFAERGSRSVSLSEIAKRVGISEPGVLHHFGSKDGLLLAVLDRMQVNDTEIVDGAFESAANCRDALLALSRHHTDNPTHARLHTILVAESLDADHAAHAYFTQRYDRVRSRLAVRVAADQARGLITDSLDPHELAIELTAVMDGLQVQWMLDPSIDMRSRLSDYLDRLS